MRRSIDAADVTAADVAKARETVRPSLDPVSGGGAAGVLRGPLASWREFSLRSGASLEHEVERCLGGPPESREAAFVDNHRRSRASPAWAPSAGPLRASETGTQIWVDAPYITRPTGLRLSLHLVVREGFHDHRRAVVVHRLAGMARDADRIAHVVQTVEESDEVESAVRRSRPRPRPRTAHSPHRRPRPFRRATSIDSAW